MPHNKLRAEHKLLINRLKDLEEQVEQSANKLELAKSNFLKNIYHEIRTPLNSIVGFTNLLNRDSLITKEDKENYTKLINKSSSDFLRIMDDIIQASLLEAGMIDLKNAPCNLGAYMEESHTYFSIRKHIKEKNSIALLQNVQEEFKDVSVVIDKFRVSQILTQLIDNALKFSNKGTVEYGYSIKNKTIEFFVKNTGGFIQANSEELIFSRFSKDDQSAISNKGLGLGLSICKELAELMGGKISYKSEKKMGTGFYFSIPYIPVEAELDKVNLNKTTNESFELTAKKDRSSFAV
jgi:signal transduction histidine kinase